MAETKPYKAPRPPMETRPGFEEMLSMYKHFAAASAALRAGEYMHDRNWEPFKPSEEWGDDPIQKYDFTPQTDAPKPTGIQQYNMAKKGPEGEAVHTPPMTGDSAMDTYDMRADSPGKGYHRDPETGEIIANRGPQPKGSPEINEVIPTPISNPEGIYLEDDVGLPKSKEQDVQYFENPEAIDYGRSETEGVMEELMHHDVNAIEDFETKKKISDASVIPL